MYSSLTEEEEEEASLHISHICIFPRYLPPCAVFTLSRAVAGNFPPLLHSCGVDFPSTAVEPLHQEEPSPLWDAFTPPPTPLPAPPRYHFGKLYPRPWIHIRAGRCAWLLPPRRARLILMHYSPPASYMHIQHRGGNLQLQKRSENSQEMRERRGRAERAWII